MIIKVCGMRDPNNVKRVSKLKIDSMGFIFYKKSPRYILDGKRPWTGTCPTHLYSTGVFVNARKSVIMRAAFDYGLDILQLHGPTSSELCRSLLECGWYVIKAIPVKTEADLKVTKKYEGCVTAFLFDTKSTGYGGSGQSFDWSILKAYKGETPFLLSGGICPENLDAILKFQHPRFAGIDLNSGFEKAPGMKHVQKLKEFVSALRTSTNTIQHESNNFLI